MRVLLWFGGRLPTNMTKYLKSSSLLTKTLRPAVNRLLPHGFTIVSVISGTSKGRKLYIDPRHEKYYWTGLHEPHLQTAVHDMLKQGDTFWDIGAHIGLFSLIASDRVGSEGTVHSFEPMNENRARLYKTLEANEVTNVKVHDEAVSDHVSTAVLHGHTASLMWSLRDREADAGGQPVSCTTIDALVSQLGCPTLIKIDAEGSELDVLKGAKNTVNEHSPAFLVEFTDQTRVDLARELLPQYDFMFLAANHWRLSSRSSSRHQGA